MIEVTFKSNSTAASDGLRSWLGYVRREVTAKIKDCVQVEQKHAYAIYKMGDHLIRFNTVVSSDGLSVSLQLDTLDQDHKAISTPPIPGLVVLMVSLHLVAGRSKAGVMIPLQADLNGRVFIERAQVPAAYAYLKNILPEKWYLPYAEGISASDEYLKAPRKK